MHIKDEYLHSTQQLDHVTRFITQISQALTCLMIASKMQNSEVHLMAQKVRQTVQACMNDILHQQYMN